MTMKKLMTLALLFIMANSVICQINYLEKGNQQLNDKNFAAAEQTFLEAINLTLLT